MTARAHTSIKARSCSGVILRMTDTALYRSSKVIGFSVILRNCPNNLLCRQSSNSFSELSPSGAKSALYSARTAAVFSSSISFVNISDGNSSSALSAGHFSVERMMSSAVMSAPQRFFINTIISLSESLPPSVALVRIYLTLSALPSLAHSLRISSAVSIPVAPLYMWASSSIRKRSFAPENM